MLIVLFSKLISDHFNAINSPARNPVYARGEKTSKRFFGSDYFLSL